MFISKFSKSVRSFFQRIFTVAGHRELAYGMEFFEKYSYIDGVNDHSLSAPWRYPAELLLAGGDNPNPLVELLAELRRDGHNIDAALFQYSAMRHWLEMNLE